jgi:hypothetical protein
MKQHTWAGGEDVPTPFVGSRCCPDPVAFFAPRRPGATQRDLLAFCVRGTRVVPAGAVATGGECEEFRRWVDTLAAEGNEALVQVRQWGFTYDLKALQVQLSRALLVSTPAPVCRRVGRRLLELLARLQDAACFLLEER